MSTDMDKTYEHDRTVMKKFRLKIVYNKKGCIGAGHCALSDPYNFEIDEDFKGILTDSKEIMPGVFEKIVETDEPHLVINAAKTCTPHVISIIDMDTKKRIAP